MKAHLLTILVIDHDELGAENVTDTIENQHQEPRISPSVVFVDSKDIGEVD